MSKLKIRKKLLQAAKKAGNSVRGIVCLSTTGEAVSASIISNGSLKKFASVVGIMSTTSAVFALTYTMAPSANAADLNAVDTIVLIDESGSMGGEQNWLRQVIPTLESAFQAQGLGSGTDANRYGLVGFGSGLNPGNLGRSLTDNGNLFFDASQYNSVSSDLRLSGSFEDGYSAIDFALNNYNFRPGARVNFILATDEDRDNGNPSLTSENILSRLQSAGVLLNSVVDADFDDANNNTALGIDSEGFAYLPDGAGGFIENAGGVAVSGAGNTINDYVNLSLSTGGAAWDLSQLRQGGSLATSFTNAFIDVKVQEVLRQPGGNQSIPEPNTIIGSAIVLGLGISSSLKKVHSTKQKANSKG
jgi:hypothetical protein